MNSKEMILSVFATVFKVVFLVIVGMFVFKWSVIVYEYGTRIFNEPPMAQGEGRSIVVVVNEGDTAEDIGLMLQKKGLIRDATLFRVQEMVSAYKGRLRSGTYELRTSMTTDEMMRIMASSMPEAE